jgi:16S rRNA (cytosine1402-N4)-methyltransferase
LNRAGDERKLLVHHPVLLEETLKYLDPKPGDTVLDGTFGGGGYSAEILKRITPGGTLIAVDRDPDAIERGKSFLAERAVSIVLVNDNFRNIEAILSSAGRTNVNGVVFDLGLSSYKLDSAERGFSFRQDGPLDMRYNTREGVSARDVVNHYGKEEIENIIRDYGQERHASLLASAIVRERKKQKIDTTAELAEIIDRAVGSKYRRQKLHPACRAFQGFRIFVNDELNALAEGIEKAFDALLPGGRICVISFHSLEDRIVKNFFRNKKISKEALLLTKKPVTPSGEEMRTNPRSRSAKLRAAERTI